MELIRHIDSLSRLLLLDSFRRTRHERDPIPIGAEHPRGHVVFHVQSLQIERGRMFGLVVVV